jgi:hypothetical protein
MTAMETSAAERISARITGTKTMAWEMLIMIDCTGKINKAGFVCCDYLGAFQRKLRHARGELL